MATAGDAGLADRRRGAHVAAGEINLDAAAKIVPGRLISSPKLPDGD